MVSSFVLKLLSDDTFECAVCHHQVKRLACAAYCRAPFSVDGPRGNKTVTLRSLIESLKGYYNDTIASFHSETDMIQSINHTRRVI